jgi:hypothetical protein
LRHKKGDTIGTAVIHQAANLHQHHRRSTKRSHVVRGVPSGSQITSLIVMPGFVAPGIVAAHQRK